MLKRQVIRIRLDQFAEEYENVHGMFYLLIYCTNCMPLYPLRERSQRNTYCHSLTPTNGRRRAFDVSKKDQEPYRVSFIDQ